MYERCKEAIINYKCEHPHPDDDHQAFSRKPDGRPALAVMPKKLPPDFGAHGVLNYFTSQ